MAQVFNRVVEESSKVIYAEPNNSSDGYSEFDENVNVNNLESIEETLYCINKNLIEIIKLLQRDRGIS